MLPPLLTRKDRHSPSHISQVMHNDIRVLFFILLVNVLPPIIQSYAILDLFWTGLESCRMFKGITLLPTKVLQVNDGPLPTFERGRQKLNAAKILSSL